MAESLPLKNDVQLVTQFPQSRRQALDVLSAAESVLPISDFEVTCGPMTRPAALNSSATSSSNSTDFSSSSSITCSMTFCRSDPLLQRKKAGLSSEARGHGGATRSGEPYTQGAPVSDALQYQMIGLPPSDYIAKPPPAATTDKVIIMMLTTIHAFIEHKMNSDNKFQKF